jgi:hypothetical protein
MKKSGDRNLKTGELISDIAPKNTPEFNTAINVRDDNYTTDVHGDVKLSNHEDLDMNIYTVNGIPSRWEHNKKHSRWHFDNQMDPDDDERIYKVLCRFSGDFKPALDIIFEEAHEETICNYRPRNRSIQDRDLHDAEMMDVRRGTGGLQTDVSCCYMLNIHNMKKSGKFRTDDRPEFNIFFNIVKELGIDVHQMRVNCQMLGQCTPMHIDQSMRYNRPYWREKWLEGGGDKDSTKLRRVLVNLLPWEYGHVWSFGSHYYSHYPAGEAITFDCFNAPHGTANSSYSPRVTLQITGFISDKTRELMENGSKDLVINV